MENKLLCETKREERKREKLTDHPLLLLPIQTPLRINTLFQIPLRCLTEFKILQGDSAHELEILFEPISTTLAVVKVVVEFHARLAYLPFSTSAAAIGVSVTVTGTDSKRTHPPAVEIEGAYGVEVEKQTVVWLCRVGEVAGVGVVTVNLEECGRVLDAEIAMSILAMQAFLVPVDHCFPVEFARVREAASVGKMAKVVFVEEVEEG
jgi:hypothetical protein